MPFAPVTFTDNVTPLNKATFDALQAGVIAAERTENKGVASGYASLDSGGKVPVAQALPTVVNGQWLKGSGGAAIWSAIALADLPVTALGGQEQCRVEIATGGPTGLTSTGVGDVMLTLPSFTADGVSDYEVEVSYGVFLSNSATGLAYLLIAEGGVQKAPDIRVRADAVGNGGFWRLKLSARPSAAAHVFTINFRGDGTSAGYVFNNTAPGNYQGIRARVLRV